MPDPKPIFATVRLSGLSMRGIAPVRVIVTSSKVGTPLAVMFIEASVFPLERRDNTDPLAVMLMVAVLPSRW